MKGLLIGLVCFVGLVIFIAWSIYRERKQLRKTKLYLTLDKDYVDTCARDPLYGPVISGCDCTHCAAVVARRNELKRRPNDQRTKCS
jgi:hypothetical protein